MPTKKSIVFGLFLSGVFVVSCGTTGRSSFDYKTLCAGLSNCMQGQ